MKNSFFLFLGILNLFTLIVLSVKLIDTRDTCRKIDTKLEVITKELFCITKDNIQIKSSITHYKGLNVPEEIYNEFRKYINKFNYNDIFAENSDILSQFYTYLYPIYGDTIYKIIVIELHESSSIIQKSPNI